MKRERNDDKMSIFSVLCEIFAADVVGKTLAVLLALCLFALAGIQAYTRAYPREEMLRCGVKVTHITMYGDVMVKVSRPLASNEVPEKHLVHFTGWHAWRPPFVLVENHCTE